MINALPKSLIEAATQILLESHHPMIDVDGEMKHRHNSEGRPIHHTDEGIRNFHRWFGNSKVIDKHGRPLVVYHGTNSDFNKFDFNKSREHHTVWGTDRPSVASEFALYRTVWNDANVMPVYVKAHHIKEIEGNYKNIREVDSPLYDPATKDEHDKYDAIHFKNVKDDVGPDLPLSSNIWAIHKTAQIKSVVGNNGDFHPEKDTITETTIENKFRALHHKLDEQFYFDDILNEVIECIDIITEAFDSEMPLHDVTHIAKEDDPERFEYYKKNGIRNVKVEYNPDTDEVIHTLYRDGAWEIHHQSRGITGEKIQSNKQPVKFIGKMYQFIKDKIDSGEKVRIMGTHDMIGNYHKIANKIANKHGGASVSEIENGIDFHRIGKPIKEFYIYPSKLDECTLPLFFKTIHESMRFAKKHFPDSPKLLEYENNLRKQGHIL